MAEPIDFYFDFSSPYGYLASARIDELGARYGRAVRWHPMLLGAVFKTTGGKPLITVPIKGEYAAHDFARTARFHGIPFCLPSAFPLPTQAAARAMLWMREQFGEAQAVDFAKAVYRAYFVDDVDISDPEQVLQLAQAFGADPAALAEGIAGAPIKDALRAQVDAAMARGVFGSPFMIVDGEPFWGFDRFDQLDAFLKNGSI